jgi:glycosyltransferase involved in cell wall biosynthesis
MVCNHPAMSEFPAASNSVQQRNSAHVDVCVCTFRRDSVVDLIASLSRLDLPATTQIRIIVADNDDTPSARTRVEAAFAAHNLTGVYLHAPARNISIARNACLDAATAPLAAFVDDDETVRPDWLGRLLAEQARTNAAVVFARLAHAASLIADPARLIRRAARMFERRRQLARTMDPIPRGSINDVWSGQGVPALRMATRFLRGVLNPPPAAPNSS